MYNSSGPIISEHITLQCHVSQDQNLINYVGSLSIAMLSFAGHLLKTYLANRKKDSSSESSHTQANTAHDIENQINTVTSTQENTNEKTEVMKGATTCGCALLGTATVTAAIAFTVAVPIVNGWTSTMMNLECTGVNSDF